MAYNKNLYSSDTDALDAGIIYDQNELMMQDEVNAAIKNGDLIVGQADNLASKMNQFSTGEFIVRATGGDASLSDGDGHLVLIRGNMIHTGYIAKSVDMTVTPIERDPSAGEFTAQIDDDLFLAEMEDTSGTMVFTYGSSGWDYDPANYGIMTDGLALPGDVISVAYQKEVRGTITQSNPSSFYSTGWNLYDHDLLRAKVVHYSDTYGFGIEGTYTQLLFSETLEGETEPITVTNGRFTVPSDGYVFVIGGNDTDTAIWMTWSDWQTEPNGGVWEAYSESEIDLSTIMATYFVNGLMAVGSYHDEIDLSLGKVTANVGKMTYSDENLDDVIAMGVEYDYDNSYIYYGLTEPIVSQISLDNTYAAYDHGIEYYTVTQVPIYTQTLYGINLKNRLERDVVTISQQALSASEQAQVATNLNVVNKSGDTMTGPLHIKGNFVSNGTYSSNKWSEQFLLDDSEGTNIGMLRSGHYANGIELADLFARRKINGSDVFNEIQLRIAADGTRSVTTSDPAIWRNALNAVNKAGDTMTGSLEIDKSSDPRIILKNTAIDSTSTTIATGQFTLAFHDKNSRYIAYLQPTYNDAGRSSLAIAARNYVNGSNVTNGMNLFVSKNGTRSVSLDVPDAWRSALGLGTSGALPITIAQGGTGQTELIHVSSKTSIITAGSGVTISNAYYCQWGKSVQIFLIWSTSSAITVQPDGNAANVTIGTLVSGKRPKITSVGTSYGDSAGPAFYLVGTDGVIQLGGCGGTGSVRTIAANTVFHAGINFLLP